MSFLISPETARILAIVCAVAALAWSWLEFRRPNHRQWPLRVLAALIATAALAALGLRPAWREEPGPPPAPEEAALWTPSLVAETRTAVPRDVSAARVFSLPGVATKPGEAIVVPDIAFIRREYPRVQTLHLFGDGIHEFDADTLSGLRLIFHARSSPWTTPGISQVSGSREVALGDPVVWQGRVTGVASGGQVSLVLTAPDGSNRALMLSPDDDGSATFAIVSPPTAATGRFVWQLELRADENGRVLAAERVGASIVPPVLPRVLILESSPRVDTARLRRWLGDRGAQLAIRTQLSRDRFRISAVNGAREAVELIDAGTLEAFDLLVTDARTMSELDDAQRATLRAAVGEPGLGVLVIADESTTELAKSATDAAVADEFLFPWKFTRDSRSDEEEERVARLHWPGADLVPHDPLPAPPFEIARRGGQRPLIRDGQGRPLVTAAGRGRGQIALSLVRETWRWSQADEAGAFASLWSYLFSELARPESNSDGRWSVANDDGGPLFVNQPVKLRWSGRPDKAPMPALVAAADAPEPARLALAQDPREASRWDATYWPQRPGWHRVSSPNGGRPLDFFVAESMAWPQVAVARRRAATDRLAAWSTRTVNAPTDASIGTVPVEPYRGWFFAALFACLTYLWLEARALRLSTSITHIP